MGVVTDETGGANSGQTAQAARDAEQLAHEDLPFRDPPHRLAGRCNKYQVVFRRSVLNDIRAHGLASPDVEVCGVMVGNLYRDGSGPYCSVEANIRGNYASGRNAQVTFTSETWTHIHQQMDARFPAQRILGWYHTHPGFGIFLSEMDVFIQENFFSEPWQIAFVDDPKGGDRGVFVWRGGIATREAYLVDENVAEESALAPGGGETPQDEQSVEADRAAAAGRRKILLAAFVICDLLFFAALAAVAVWWWRR